MSVTNKITCYFDEFEFDVTYTYYPPEKGRSDTWSTRSTREGLVDWGTPDEPAESDFELEGFSSLEDIVRLNYPFELFKEFEELPHSTDEEEERRNYIRWVNEQTQKLLENVEEAIAKDAAKLLSSNEFDCEKDVDKLDDIPF